MAKKKKIKNGEKYKKTVNSTNKTAKSPVPKRLVKPELFTLKNHLFPLAIIAVLISLLYFRCIPYDYVLDDKIVITDNNYTKAGFSGIWDILSTESFQGYFGEQKNLVQGARYRPLSIVTFAIEHQFFGMNKEISHTINILLYILCCFLIYRMVLFLYPILQEKKWYTSIAFLSCLLYAMHPVHVEAVANIKGRDEIMAMIGSITALIFSVKYMYSGNKLQLLGVALAFLFGIFSKETTITFLAIIPITLYFVAGRIDKRIWLPSLIALVCAIFYIVVRYNVIGYVLNSEGNFTDLMNNPFYGMNGEERSATIMYVLGQYLKLDFLPHPLTHDYYPYHVPIMHWTDVFVITSLLVYLLLFAYSIYGMFTKNKLAYGIIFYLTTLTIVSNVFVNVGTFMNERFLFMPSLGIMIFLSAIVMKNLAHKFNVNKDFLSVGLIMIAGLFFVKSWTRIPAWENTLSLNSTAIKVSKNSARLNCFMATAIFNHVKTLNDPKEKLTQLKEAEGYIEKSVEIHPNYFNGNLMLAGIAAELQKYEPNRTKLLKQLKQAAINRPDVPYITEYCDYLNQQNADQVLMDFYYDLAYNNLYVKKRNTRWAIHYLEKAYQAFPGNPGLKAALFQCYNDIGNVAKASQYAK